MPGLVDLVLPKRTKTLYGVDIRITGIDADGVAALWDRFPQLADVAASGQFGVREILSLGPDAAAAFIAAGTGAAGDANAEAIARDLPLGDKMELIADILEMSLPRGPGPFVDAGVRILQSLGMLSPEQKNAGVGGNSGSLPTP
jgi:hypothetical protein